MQNQEAGVEDERVDVVVVKEGNSWVGKLVIKQIWRWRNQIGVALAIHENSLI